MICRARCRSRRSSFAACRKPMRFRPTLARRLHCENESCQKGGAMDRQTEYYLGALSLPVTLAICATLAEIGFALPTTVMEV